MFWDFEEPAVLFETAGFLLFGVFKRIIQSKPVLVTARWGFVVSPTERTSYRS
jgi:hypothetical protein